MGPLFHACSRVQFIIGQVGVLRVPRYALGPRLVGWFRNFCPPSAGLVFGPSSVRLFFSCPYSMPAKVPQRCSQLSFPHGTIRPPTATGSERGQNRCQNEARTRPENSFGNPSALAAVYHQPGSKSLAGV